MWTDLPASRFEVRETSGTLGYADPLYIRSGQALKTSHDDSTEEKKLCKV